ncbi:MAG: hypothetical protein K0S28_1736 [Paucimonas sp.]|nr:hypothetical protein [Paucimonas sp.]
MRVEKKRINRARIFHTETNMSYPASHTNPISPTPEFPSPIQPQRELEPGQQPDREIPGLPDEPTIVPDPQSPEIDTGTPPLEIPPLT